jgi:hypothetical protein
VGKNKYTIRKYDGDDIYSWAIFKTEDVRGIRGVVFHGQAKPIDCGLDKDTATWRKNALNTNAKNTS